MDGRVKYAIWGVLMLALFGTAEWRGWSLLRATQVRDVPRSVRDNPGAYRSHYSGSGRYLRGK